MKIACLQTRPIVMTIAEHNFDWNNPCVWITKGRLFMFIGQSMDWYGTYLTTLSFLIANRRKNTLMKIFIIISGTLRQGAFGDLGKLFHFKKFWKKLKKVDLSRRRSTVNASHIHIQLWRRVS